MKRIIYLLIIIVTFISCDDVFEPDIDDETVVILAPSDGAIDDDGSLTFWWEEVEDAERYDVQIVTPSFTDVDDLVLDTTGTFTNFEFQLDSGDYQWRVRGRNDGSETDYVVRSFSVQ